MRKIFMSLLIGGLLLTGFAPLSFADYPPGLVTQCKFLLEKTPEAFTNDYQPNKKAAEAAAHVLEDCTSYNICSEIKDNPSCRCRLVLFTFMSHYFMNAPDNVAPRMTNLMPPPLPTAVPKMNNSHASIPPTANNAPAPGDNNAEKSITSQSNNNKPQQEIRWF